MQEAPKQLCELEYTNADESLQRNIELVENTIAQMEKDFAAKINVPELLNKHKVCNLNMNTAKYRAINYGSKQCVQLFHNCNYSLRILK